MSKHHIIDHDILQANSSDDVDIITTTPGERIAVNILHYVAIDFGD